VLYELTTGRHPFAAASEASVLWNIVEEVPAPPSLRNPGAPAALEGLILRMLAKDPRLRPSAAEVEAVLADLAVSPPGTARPARPARPAGGGTRRSAARTSEPPCSPPSRPRRTGRGRWCA